MVGNPGALIQAVPNYRFSPWVLLYALLIAYSSTVIGPMGLHYVPIDPTEAWSQFIGRAFTWVDNGSDQRADWMGNLSMYIPFGFLLTGTLWPRRGGAGGRGLAMLAAFAVGVGFLLAVKYAQIFFPPRTVTLNYVVAQSVGTAVGAMVFALTHGRMSRMVWHGASGGRDNLRTLLRVYAAALSIFLLMPLDFALSVGDLMAVAQRLPSVLFAMPGAGRPAVVQATALVASTVAAAPFGLLMVVGPNGRNRLFGVSILRGIVWMLVLFALTAMLLSGAPTFVSLFCRMIGVGAGVCGMRWLVRQDPRRLRQRLRTWSLLLLPLYLLVLLAVNGVLSTHWRDPAETLRDVYVLGLIPLFDYYIVTKAAAAKNIVGHLAMYAPLGVFAWLRGYRPRAGFVWAFVLALGIETARYLRPGLEGDVNAVAVAGLAALFAARLMPGLWRMLEGAMLPALATPNGDQAPGWRERAAAGQVRALARAATDEEAEHF